MAIQPAKDLGRWQSWHLIQGGESEETPAQEELKGQSHEETGRSGGGWQETQQGVNMPKPGSGQGRDRGQAGGREVTLEKH